MEFLNPLLEGLKTIFTNVYQARSQRKAIRLQEDCHRGRDIFHFNTKMNTKEVVQLNKAIKQYNMVIQYTKDRLRTLIHKLQGTEDRHEIILQLSQLDDNLATTYSRLCYHFYSTRFSGHAHTIKTDLLNIIRALEKPSFDADLQLEAIRLVSVHQEQLCTGIRNLIRQMQTSPEQSYS
ncbi:hypothetical protein [Chitinophaga qingshengii]|uniref:CHAD domain-containing protein n=1 Tax=Chitinophaga qingshengii TaxID=1569794 RepID=A0ABR7TSB2_9BACT|nr:hypothetical protein [Chitinophaga qingshengii]MBC9932910.1 hypothetical protein [Chitinophaga qingshengii]